jgi:ubiquinone/menaquinone biosynthesis C-methylase UbiE/uncharacterized protein YbaR (Trm112 family)
MKTDFARSLRCLRCRGDLLLHAALVNAEEVREGELSCPACGSRYSVRRGIADVLDPTDEVLAREAEGWIRLAGALHEELLPVMTALPHYPHPPWPHVAPDFFQVFELVDFAGKRVIDLGAGRTWSSRYLSKLGRAAEVVAVDIMTKRFLGLETAEVFFEQDRIFFERVRADFHRLPFPDGWADAAVSCAAIHHSGHLDQLFAEVHRVLKPGGTLVFVSEPTKSEAIPGHQPQNDETAAGLNEHYFSLREYRTALAAAGFRHRRVLPRSIAYRLLYPDPDFSATIPAWVRRWASRPRGRRLLLTALASRAIGDWLYGRWSLPLSMIAEKP